MPKTVFLVDDDIDLVEQNKRVLEEKGYNVTSAHTAKGAIKKLENIKPDVLVLDMVMEHKTAGLGLVKDLKDIQPNLPVIMLSGNLETMEPAEKSESTFNQIKKYLDKPVRPNALIKEIEELMKNL